MGTIVRRPRPRPVIGAPGLLLSLVLSLLLGGCGADQEQARLCAAAIGAFETEPGPIEILERAPAAGAEHGVSLRWRAGAGRASRGITCSFAAGPLERGRLELTGVAVEGRAPLSEMELFWLRRWLAIRPGLEAGTGPEPRPEPRPSPGGALPLLYFLQQLANAVTLSCVYGLLAVGYTLAYAVLGQIILAFGDIAMIGGVTTAILAALFGMFGMAGLPAALLAMLALAAATAGACAWSADRLVFGRLREAAPHMPLIAAVGLGVLLQEAVRLLQHSGDLWVAPPFAASFVLARTGRFDLVITLSQVLILLLAAGVYAGLRVLLRSTRFGLAFRACADDRLAAELLGVDAGRTIALAFLIAGACAGTAAFVVVQYYGVANFLMGLMLGFKALTAAILGGIGSVSGAMLGGAVIAGLEVFWSAYFDIAYKDVAVFGLLVLLLVFRPGGLLGRGRP